MGYYLVYVSAATRLFSRDDLDDILSKSYVNNLRAGITGALLYKGGNVMQALEGDESAVRALFATIATDPRHKSVISVISSQQAERQFDGWSMAFLDLDAPELVSHPGYSDFLNTRLSGAEFADNPSKCRRLLSTFKRTM